MTQRRTLMITPGFTLLDYPADDTPRAVRTTPRDTWSGGLGALLDRVAPGFKDEGTVLLDRAAARALKLPVDEQDTTTEGVEHALAAGWSYGSLGPWTTFYRDGRPTIVVGVAGRIDPRRCPLVSPDWSQDTVFSLSMWQELTGRAWRGTPGVAGLSLLRSTLPTFMVKGRPVKPAALQPSGPEDASEADFSSHDWSRPALFTFEHGYDATRMYLAAAGTCEQLAPWNLKHTGRISFSAKLAGWWLVELGPWNDERIPAPAGPGPSRRWVTTPTLALLDELARQNGAHQTYEIIDSWTTGGKRLLRKWSETLEGAYQTARERMNERDPDGLPSSIAQDAQRVAQAVKSAYKETLGLIKPTEYEQGKTTFYWPYNHYAVIAHARATLWRKVWATGLRDDRWPVTIDVDNVWYGSDAEDPDRGKPRSISLLDREGRPDRLGTFKVKGTRMVKR